MNHKLKPKPKLKLHKAKKRRNEKKVDKASS